MSKKFTKLMAAIALLVFMMPTMAGWGQANVHTSGDGILPTSSYKVKISENSYTAVKFNKGDSKTITIPAGTTKLYVHAATWKGDSNSTLSFSATGVTFSSSSINLIADDNISGTATTYELNCQNCASTSYFFELDLSGVSTETSTTVTLSAASGKRPVVWGINVVVGGGSTDPSITISGDEIQNDKVTLNWNDQEVYTADVVYGNMDTPSSDDVTVGVYSDESCETVFTGNWFTADFATNSVESIEYAFLENNASSDSRTVYMRVETYNAEETDLVPCNVIAITQSAQPQVATPTFSPAAGAVASGTEVSISCATENATIYYTVNNGELTEYTESIVITEATTIEAYASAGGYADSETVTANYTIAEIHTVAWALENTPSTGVYVQGIVSSFYNENIMGDGQNFRYYISDNGGTYNGELLVYKGKDLGNEAFTSVDDLMIGDVVTIYGDLYDYQGTKEFNAGNYIVSKTRPVHNPYNLTIPEWVNFELFAFYGLDSEPAFDYSDEEADHWGTIQVNDGTQVELSISAMLNYEIQALVVDGVDVTDQLDESGLYVFMMPDHAVTVTATATRLPYYTVTFTTNGIDDVTMEVNQGDPIGSLPTANASYIPEGYTFVGWYNGDYEVSNTAPTFITEAFEPTGNITLKAVFAIGNSSGSSDTYALVSDVNDLNDGDIIILVSTGSYKVSGVTHYFTVANATVNSSNLMDPVDVTISDNKVTSTDVAPITLVEVTGGWKLQMGSQYLMNNAGKNEIVLDDEGAINTITISSNNATIGGITDGADTRNIYYNPNSGNGRFAYYKSKQKDISIYKQESSVTYSNYRTSLTESYTLTVTGYDNGGGWNLIASPVTVSPATVEGMVVANTDENYEYFDLYYFDQTGGENGKEWKNYKANHFDLELGKGYLYANANTVDLTFTGVMNGDFEDVDLPYDADDDIKSLYLAGNSKTMAENFYVYDGNSAKKTVNFLTINETGDGFITTSSNEFEAAALQGFFVQSAGEDWTLSTADMDAKSGTPELLNVMVSQNRGALIDNAIVSFGNAPLMSKFYLSDNSTRVFIQQNGEEMAVVRTEAQGEMPVNFKAAENGTYTLTVNPEGVEMNYLHLIDNMTGADIDLLAATSTGSVATYTFNASTTDYSSRFRLVFAANNEDGVSTGSTAFAFYSNGTWVINNTGEATLQVVDVNGRILSSETVNGSVSKAINAPAGVYMLRLINGNDVKTQKIVVR